MSGGIDWFNVTTPIPWWIATYAAWRVVKLPRFGLVVGAEPGRTTLKGNR